MRAVENGYSVVRPDTHGLARAVDYQGRVLAPPDYFATDRQVDRRPCADGGARTRLRDRRRRVRVAVRRGAVAADHPRRHGRPWSPVTSPAHLVPAEAARLASMGSVVPRKRLHCSVQATIRPSPGSLRKNGRGRGGRAPVEPDVGRHVTRQNERRPRFAGASGVVPRSPGPGVRRFVPAWAVVGCPCERRRSLRRASANAGQRPIDVTISCAAQPRWTCRAMDRRIIEWWQANDVFDRSSGADGRRPAVGVLRGPADRQRHAGHPPHRGEGLQGPLSPVPDDAGLLGAPPRRLGLPRPAGRARGGEGTGAQRQARHREDRRRRVQRPVPRPRCCGTSDEFASSASGWATGSTWSTRTRPCPRSTWTASGGH